MLAIKNDQEETMKLFIDDAHVREIERLIDLYPIDGVTTNPSILSRIDQNPADTLRQIREVIGQDRLLFVQAVPKDTEGMVKDAEAIVRAFGPNTIVKIPATPAGFKAIRILKEEKIPTCGTVVYMPFQAYLAAKAGAVYVAPYVNRIDNMGYDGISTVKVMQDILVNNHMDTEVLAASFRNSQQVLALCQYGVGAATASPSVIDSFVKNAAVDEAVEDFIHDFEKVAPGKTMADLL